MGRPKKNTEEDEELKDETVEATDESEEETATDESDEDESSDDSDEEDEESDETPAASVSNKKVQTGGRVIFHLRNRDVPTHQSSRIFEESVHGKNFRDLADQFEESNKNRIINRVNE